MQGRAQTMDEIFDDGHDGNGDHQVMTDILTIGTGNIYAAYRYTGLNSLWLSAGLGVLPFPARFDLLNWSFDDPLLDTTKSSPGFYYEMNLRFSWLSAFGYKKNDAGWNICSGLTYKVFLYQRNNINRFLQQKLAVDLMCIEYEVYPKWNVGFEWGLGFVSQRIHDGNDLETSRAPTFEFGATVAYDL